MMSASCSMGGSRVIVLSNSPVEEEQLLKETACLHRHVSLLLILHGGYGRH